MKSGNNALILLLFGLFTYAMPTVARATPPPPGPVFNGSVTEAARKSSHPVANGVFRLVIDAGHGGKDPGGMGANSREKHIALSVARHFAEGVRNNFGPAVEVVMTRDDDTFIPLHERAAIANRGQADLFVSIHANIMPGSSATRGTETFVMGQHVARHNLEVAKRENAAVLLEDNYEQHYDYDPNSDEGHILMNMFQHAFLERSILFAELVERQFAEHGRKSRGVKQAGFVVLKETAMPSVLVETGFMSNPTEEAYLLSDGGQRELARALLLAFTTYYDTYYSVAGAPTPHWQSRGPAPAPVVLPPPAPVAAPSPTAVPLAGPAAKPVSPPVTAPVAYNVPVSRGPAATTMTSRTLLPTPAPTDVLRREVAPAGGPLYPQAVPPAADTLPYRFKDASTKEKRTQRPRPGGIDLSTVPDADLVYGLQIVASSGMVDTTTTRWQQLPYPIVVLRERGLNLYQLRGIRTPDELLVAKRRVREAGFKESMGVVYYRGQRLAQPQLRYLLRR